VVLQPIFIVMLFVTNAIWHIYLLLQHLQRLQPFTNKNKSAMPRYKQKDTPIKMV
jgi:hypothetical protein